MPARRVFQSRAERVIASARVVLAAGALLGFAVDPQQPHGTAAIVYAVLAGYCAWALLALALVPRLSGQKGWAVTLHGVDLGVFTALCLLTEGPTSPFFLLFNFSVLAAVLKWRWQGMLWTLIPVLAFYLLAGAVFSLWLSGEFEPDRFVVRFAELLVAGILLGYFGWQQQRIFEDIARLTVAPVLLADVPATEAKLPLRWVLSYVAGVFDAPRVLLVWADAEEPWVYVAQWGQDRFEQERLPPEELEPLTRETFADRIFLTDTLTATAFLDDAGRVRSGGSANINPTLLRRYRVSSAISLPVRTEDLRGRIFVLEKPHPSPEDLSIAAVLVPRVEAMIEHAAAAQAAQRAAASEDRVQVARDLHDGILQVLAGTALQLQALATKAGLENDKTLAGLQNWLVQEQRELRSFIAQLEPGDSAHDVGSIGLRSTLAPLAETLRQQWGMEVELQVDPPDAELPAHLRLHLCQLIREGAANAARHGRATQLRIAMKLDGAGLRLDIEDNGRGFPWTRRDSSKQTTELATGPRSLSWRVKRLSGSLAIGVGKAGAKVTIEIPIAHPPEWTPA